MPKTDEFGFGILFLLLPGIVALGIIKSVGPKRPRTDFENGVQIFAYGIVCYLITGLIEGAWIWFHSAAPTKGFLETVAAASLALATLNPATGLATGQIAFAVLVALIVGLAVANFQTNSIPHQTLRRWRLTRRTNEVDIWQFTLNSPQLDEWVTVRHHANGKVYQGWVRAYSDGGDERELLLGDVEVYATAEGSTDLIRVDQVPVLYLGLDRTNAVIELRTVT